ncbi:hypothetical protein [Streptomyces sp. NPDC005907]|uniref:hypothetical protein n=1 Tax=Streptomyces sp. NPDC005907 TaxID=3154571 RepID=UPI0033EFA8F0
MTLEEHARAIEAAIQAAAEEGHELDNTYGVPIYKMELNTVVDGEFTATAPIDLPHPTYW